MISKSELQCDVSTAWCFALPKVGRTELFAMLSPLHIKYENEIMKIERMHGHCSLSMSNTVSTAKHFSGFLINSCNINDFGERFDFATKPFSSTISNRALNGWQRVEHVLTASWILHTTACLLNTCERESIYSASACSALIDVNQLIAYLARRRAI